MTSRRVRAGIAALMAGLGACSADGESLAVPEGPRLLLAEAVGMTSVRLRWPRADVAGLRSYGIERRTNLDGSFIELAVIPAPPGDTVVYFDTTVEPEQIYGYRVSALGNAGAASDYTVIAGVRTPPRPGIDVRIITQAPAATVGDPDGYVIRIEGPTPTSGAAGVGDATAPFIRRFSPLAPGPYTVALSNLAPNCRVPDPADPLVEADTLREVAVTDEGVQTISTVTFTVDCRDPTRGTIDATVAVTGSTGNGAPFEVAAAGTADDATLPDSLRAYIQTRTVPEQGGSALFDGIRPGVYEVILRRIGEGCRVSGDSVQAVTLAALDLRRVEFAVECGGGSGGDVDDPTRPFKLRSQWTTPTPASGGTVALDVSLFLTDAPPFTIGSVDVVTGFSAAVLRADSAVAAPGFTVTDNRGTAGVVAWSAISANPSPAAGPVPLVRLWFTVVGAAGAGTRTATRVNEIADDAGDVGDGTGPYAARTQPFPEATLTVGGGGGGGGGGDNQPPTAAIAGPSPLTAAAGTPLTLSAAGSADPDGTIATYAWTFPSGVPGAATGQAATTTWAAAGSYTVTLTVTDDDGAATSVSRAVTVTGSGGGNQPPVAVIAGADPFPAVVGTPVTLSAAGSSDPESGALAYAWSVPGATPGSGTAASLTATFATPGNYTATLTVADPQGASATATRQVTVTEGAASTPIVWRNSFGPAGTDGTVAMTVTLDLRSDLAETPGSERLQSFRADSITWNAGVLEYQATTFGSNINGTATLDPSRPHRVRLQGSVVGDGPTGVVTLATLTFRVRPGATGGTATRSYLSRILGSPATLNFEYLPRTAIAEGTFPSDGGGPVPAGRYQYRSTWGPITGGQVDLVVAVDPSGFDAPEVPGADGVGGLQAVTTLSGDAAGRFTAVSTLATGVFGPATTGTLPPAVSWVATTTQPERTTLSDVATLRFTLGPGAPGTVTTVTELVELSNANGDPLPLDDDGNPANGLGRTTITEATLTVP